MKSNEVKIYRDINQDVSMTKFVRKANDIDEVKRFDSDIEEHKIDTIVELNKNQYIDFKNALYQEREFLFDLNKEHEGEYKVMIVNDDDKDALKIVVVTSGYDYARYVALVVEDEKDDEFNDKLDKFFEYTDVRNHIVYANCVIKENVVTLTFNKDKFDESKETIASYLTCIRDEIEQFYFVVTKIDDKNPSIVFETSQCKVCELLVNDQCTYKAREFTCKKIEERTRMNTLDASIRKAFEDAKITNVLYLRDNDQIKVTFDSNYRSIEEIEKVLSSIDDIVYENEYSNQFIVKYSTIQKNTKEHKIEKTFVDKNDTLDIIERDNVNSDELESANDMYDKLAKEANDELDKIVDNAHKENDELVDMMFDVISSMFFAKYKHNATKEQYKAMFDKMLKRLDA